eukprot:TRINITY_DN45023_c0_g1_i1.p1 TRINITY_DN45023_c0_g1~~TRINITY_DN45023_c0_g1_i1.p1  ORF type:complete len:210 (-),score=38.72 TRINITY_DN45023_c0_g1_i1:36-626(-)
MVTLFVSVAGGVSWIRPMMALAQEDPFMTYLFIAYVFFTIFCIFNVVTGVFCQSAIEASQQDPDLQAYQVKQSTLRLKQRATELFQKIDEDDSGIITVDEFDEALQNPEMLAYFEAIGMGVGEAWEVFKLLDEDESNSVTIKEFVEGCLKLKGGSSNVDIALVREDIERILEIVQIYLGNVEHHSRHRHSTHGYRL